MGAGGLGGWGVGKGGGGGGAGRVGGGAGVGSVHGSDTLQMCIVLTEVHVFESVAIAVLRVHIALRTLGIAYGWIAKHFGQWSRMFAKGYHDIGNCCVHCTCAL